MLNKAFNAAVLAHEMINQKRKGSGEPYWTHVERVAGIVKDEGGTEPMVDASFLHDVIEDVTPINPTFGPDWILGEFGPTVLQYVLGMTHVFTHEAYPKANRATRQGWEATRLSLQPDEVKVIKLADRYDNLNDMQVRGEIKAGFVHKYRDETRLLLPALEVDAPSIWHEAATTLKQRILLTLNNK